MPADLTLCSPIPTAAPHQASTPPRAASAPPSPALECLDLTACASLDDASLAAGGLSGLRTVCFARASGVGWCGLDALVAACPRLEAVDLSHCVGAGDREAAALAAAAGLKELRLDKCLVVMDVGSPRSLLAAPGWTAAAIFLDDKDTCGKIDVKAMEDKMVSLLF
ncbi:hypothetical protein U9M48_013947 [Paspalum notatum var. saurae]|uniref:Uncharacterized protein n=1 Tax=Paspalum notatum var. saurae TaxID=547442 RepID=A0AAQ3WK11_PASNO